MNRIRLGRPAAFALAGAVVASGGIAIAAAGGGTITACVQAQTGLLRAVDSPQDCSAGIERAVTWNQQGPQGPQGPPGPSGPSGVPRGEAASKPLGTFIQLPAGTWTGTTTVELRSEATQDVHFSGFVSVTGGETGRPWIRCTVRDAAGPGDEPLADLAVPVAQTYLHNGAAVLPVGTVASVGGTPESPRTYRAQIGCFPSQDGMIHVSSLLQAQFVQDSTGD